MNGSTTGKIRSQIPTHDKALFNMEKNDNKKTLISFVNFVHLSEEELRIVHYWRNLDYIRIWMDNSDPISIEEHLAFCSSLKTREDKKYFMIFVDNCPCGVYDLTNIDYKSATAEVGIYIINEFSHYSSAISLMVNGIINHLGIKKLLANVKKDNERALVYNIIKLKAHILGEDEKKVYIYYDYFPFDPDKDLVFKKYDCNIKF